MIKADDAIQTARSLIGTPYGSGTGELDCINLIKKVIRTSPGGVRGYQTAGTDALWASGAAGTAKKYKDLTWRQEGLEGVKPGMLAFKGKATDKAGDGQPHHVGLVSMKSRELSVIHASSANGQVVETPLTEKHGWTLIARHRYIETEEAPEMTEEGERVYYRARVVTENGRLNVRSGPSTGTNVIHRLNKGDVVDVLFVYPNGWSFIDDDGDQGYAMSSYLAPVSSSESPQVGKGETDAGSETPQSAQNEPQKRTILRCVSNGVTIELSGEWEVYCILGGDD